MFLKQNRFSFKNPLPKNTYHSTSFNLRYGKNEEGLRVAAVVSKKVDKRSTVRNGVKRRLIEIVRNKLSIEEKLSLVFYLKKEALTSDLEKEIDQAISKIK